MISHRNTAMPAHRTSLMAAERGPVRYNAFACK